MFRFMDDLDASKLTLPLGEAAPTFTNLIRSQVVSIVYMYVYISLLYILYPAFSAHLSLIDTTSAIKLSKTILQGPVSCHAYCIFEHNII